MTRELEHLINTWPDDETRELLATRADAEDDPYARRTAVNALLRGWLDHPGTRQVLMRSLVTGTTDGQFQQDFTHAVVRLWPDPETRAFLTDLTHSHHDGIGRATAARALCWRWPDSASRSVVTELVGSDTTRGARADGVQSLARHWADDRTRTLIESRVATDPSPLVRQVAIMMLARLWPDERTAAALTRAAEADEDEDTLAGLAILLRTLDRRQHHG